MPDQPFIRPARPGDGDRLAQLAEMAMHGKGDLDKVVRMARQAEKFPDDVSELSIRRRRDGMETKVRALASTRVMDRGDGQVVGFSYSVPPIGWLGQGPAVPIGVGKRVMAALVEINLLAVLPAYRRRGLGAALLADCEARYAQAGYRMAVVITEKDPASLTPWYRRHGWAFGEVDEPAHVQFWENRDLWAYYGDLTFSQRIGAKALVADASAGVRKVVAPAWRRRESIEHDPASLIVPRELLCLSGVLPS